MIKISVVLTTYNRAPLLPRVLNALAAQSFSKKNYELLIIDDGSTDQSGNVIVPFLKKNPHFRYFPKKHEGLSAGRNFGISHAGGELIAFTDDDVVPDSKWLEELWEVYQKEKPLGIEGKVVTDTQKPLFGNAPENTQGKKYIGCNSAYTKKILEKVGGYDRRFFWVRDDSDMAFRVLKHGPISFAPRAVVYHPYRPIDAMHLLKRLTIIQSDLLLFQKHPSQYMASFGFPGLSNWIQSGATYLFVATLSIVHPPAAIIPLLGYIFFRYFASMRGKLFSLPEAGLLVIVLGIRDLLYPFAFVYYFIKTNFRQVDHS